MEGGSCGTFLPINCRRARCWCVDVAARNYGGRLLLMHGEAEAQQLAMTGTLLKGKTSLSVAKPIVILVSD